MPCGRLSGISVIIICLDVSLSSTNTSIFPSPSNFIDASGTIRTYPPDLSPLEQSGIFAADNLKTAFSNSENAALSGITDFTIFNNYVHYATGESLTSVQIPYLSDYTISTGFNPYVF